jgi:hypothetical protein
MQQKIKENLQYILASFFVLFLGVVAYLAVSYSFFQNSPEMKIVNSGLDIDSDIENTAQASLTKTQVLNETYTKVSGSETGTIYEIGNLTKSIEKMSADIKLSEGTEPQSQTLLKKIILLEMIASFSISNQDKNKEQALSAVFNQIQTNLLELDKAEKNENKNLISTKALYLYNMHYVYNNSDTTSSFMNSILAQDVMFKTFLSKYKDNKWGERIAISLYLNYRIGEVDGFSDKLIISTKAVNIAKILNNFSQDLSLEEKMFLTKELNRLVLKYQTAQDTKLFKLKKTKNALPAYNIAFSLAVLQDVDSGVKSSQIKEAFKEVYSIVKRDAGSEVDNIYLQETWTNIAYANYLFNQNNKKIGPNISLILREIEKSADRFKNSPEMLGILKNVFSKSQSGDHEYNKTYTDMIEISKQDLSFGKFIQKIVK